MKRIILILVIGLIASNATIEAQEWTQIGADIEGEAVNDWFGNTVSLSSDGSIVAIGTPYNDANGPNSGHVRIFNNISGTWTQVGTDIDGDTTEGWFGHSVSLNSDGSTVAIGAIFENVNGPNSGKVRVFKNISGIWTQIGADFDGEMAQDLNGMSVSLNWNGTIVAIGAPGGGVSGQVRIYENVSDTWTQIGAVINGEPMSDEFGRTVSLSSDGSIVAIGDPGNDENGNDAGHVSVYQNLSGTWTQIGNDIDGAVTNDQFGISISLSSDGTIVAIGSIRNDSNGNDAGHVRVFQNLSGTWTQVGEDIEGEAAGDLSGISVSLGSNGTLLAVGAPYNDGNGTNSGHARIYQNIAGTWTQIGTDINGENAEDQSGYSLSLSSDGSAVAIGASRNSDNGFWSGHVRVFSNPALNTTSFQQQAILISPNPTSGLFNLKFSNYMSSFGMDTLPLISIFDLSGKLLFKKTSVQQIETIDLSNFESGLYIINIQNGNEQYISKIIKQ